MKKILRYSVLSFLILSILAITGCKKDDEGNGPDKSSLLTAHVWKFSSITTSSTDPDVQLAVNLVAAFMTNGTMTYAAGGTYTITMLGQSDSGTWELSADGKTITVDKGTADETFHTIKTLTADVLEFSESVVDEDLGTFDITYKWVK
jgi:hypothetical protein